MKILLSFTISLLCLSTFKSVAFAQKDKRHERSVKSSPNKASRQNNVKDEGKEETEKFMQEQQQVLWLLANVEEKAKRLDGSTLKIKVLAKIADTLWQHDELHARRLFAEAFNAIDSIKLDANKDQRAKIAATSGGLNPLSDLRAEILQLVAARDFKLAESLRKIIKESAPESDGNENLQSNLSEKEELAWDIAVASVKTQPERTAHFVRTQLRRGINEELGWALVNIRHENQPLAEQLFSEALIMARANIAAPENLENLALYVLPTEGEAFHGRPSASSMEALLNFLGYAADKLAAQSASGHIPAPKGAEAQHEYRTLKSLLPLFEIHTPDKVSLIRERMAVLIAAMSPQQASTVSPSQEDVAELLRQAESTVGSKRRDLRLMQVSMLAMRQGDLEQAISIAERISDLEERSIQVSLLTYQASLKALEKNDFDEAHRLARRIEFLPQRVRAFNMLANKLRASKQEDRARTALEEIWEWTNKAANSPQKAKALLILATAMTHYDAEKGFEFLSSTVKTINSIDFSSPEINRTSSRVAQVTLDMLDLDAVFSTLARINYDRAMQAAQSFTLVEVSLLAQAIVGKQALNHRLRAQKSNQPTLSN